MSGLPGPLRARLTQTATRYAFAGYTANGDPRLSTAGVPYPARTENTQHLVTGMDGRDVLAKSVTYLGPSSSGDPVFTVQDKIVLPDGTSPRVLAVDSNPDWRSTRVYYVAVHT